MCSCELALVDVGSLRVVLNGEGYADPAPDGPRSFGCAKSKPPATRKEVNDSDWVRP